MLIQMNFPSTFIDMFLLQAIYRHLTQFTIFYLLEPITEYHDP